MTATRNIGDRVFELEQQVRRQFNVAPTVYFSAEGGERAFILNVWNLGRMGSPVFSYRFTQESIETDEQGTIDNVLANLLIELAAKR